MARIIFDYLLVRHARVVSNVTRVVNLEKWQVGNLRYACVFFLRHLLYLSCCRQKGNSQFENRTPNSVY
jgi:hypothetical protein